MVKVRVQAIRWESDDFPGFVEAALSDARGERHRILEKVPVLTTLDITASFSLPLEFWIEAEMDSAEDDGVSVTLRHGVESVDGRSSFVVSAADVIWP